jgi:hypothetical protein
MMNNRSMMISDADMVVLPNRWGVDEAIVAVRGTRVYRGILGLHQRQQRRAPITSEGNERYATLAGKQGAVVMP